MKTFDQTRFEKFTRFIYNRYGIFFSEIKKDMLQAKIDKLMARCDIHSYDEYYGILSLGADGRLLTDFADAITINKTDFFREINHFDFIRSSAGLIMERNQKILRNNEIRVWSAACSTGQEPYTIAIVLKECMPEGMNIKILATDISSKALRSAGSGIYPLAVKDEIPGSYLYKYFERIGEKIKVADELKDMVTFRQFNLMDSFPFKNTFDIVFCRNTMIYFDAAIQQSLLDKFYNVMTPGGLLFIGHSESLTNKTHRLQYVQPTIYMK